MEEKNSGYVEDQVYHTGSTMTTEIVEIEDCSNCGISIRDRPETKDIYVAVGKEDSEVIKWVLDHVAGPESRVLLVHVFPPIHYITTPVGKLSTSKLSQEQMRPYIHEAGARRRNVLQKYINLCSQVKVAVDTILIESDFTTRAILELIPVLNITSLVMGTKRLSSSRRLRKGLGKGEFVRKNAPSFCEVVIVEDGKRIVERQQMNGVKPSSSRASTSQKPEIAKNPERNFFECVCFSRKSN